MSALGLDDVNDPRGVLAYAPRKSRRADDERSIRPVLERLSKSEGRVPGPRLVRKVAVQDLPPPQAEAVANGAFPMAARLAVAAGVLALVGAAAAGYMAPLTSDHAAQSSMPALAPTALPKPVQTVSIQRPADAAQPAAKILKDDARMPQPAAAAIADGNVSAAAAVPAPLQRAVATDPSLVPLKSWAAVPAEGPGWSTPPAQPAATDAQAAADETPPPKPQAKAPSHKASPAHHTRHAARHRVRHHRRSRTARAPAAPQPPAQSTQVAESQPAQPVKKLPLQAAIDRMFGNGGAAGATPQPQR